MEPERFQENASVSPSDATLTDYTPTAQDLIAWSKGWASDLWLCDFVGSGDLNYFDSSQFGLCGKFGDDDPFEEHPDFDTKRVLEAYDEQLEVEAERVRLVSLHPEVRQEANAVIDSMLHEAGVSLEVIASFKQVLPYKMAHLHAIHHPKPKAEIVSFWVLKGYGIGPEVTMERESLVSVEFNIKLHWTEVKERLRIVSERVGCETPEEKHEGWEYVFLKGDCTNKNSGSDGVLKTSSDYVKMVDVILSNTTPQTSAIVFRRSSKQETRQSNMEMEAAAFHKHHERFTPEVDKASRSAVLDEDAKDKWEYCNILTDASPSPNTARKIQRAILEDLGFLEKPYGATSQLSTEEPSTAEEYPRQVTIWLKGEGFEDEPFDCPKIPVPGPNQNNKTLWRSTKPVKGFLS